MGKKKRRKKIEKARIKDFETNGPKGLSKVKSKCCKKYKKAEHKRCKKCPCFDLLKKAA